MGQNILNEHEADKVVNRILAREKARKKGTHPMSKIILFKDTDGVIKQAHQFENVTREDITGEIEKAKQFVATLETALEDFDKLAASDEDAAATAPQVVETPAPVVEAPAPEVVAQPAAEAATPAPAPEATPAVVDQPAPAPVEQPQVAEQPAAAPVAEAPAPTPIVIQ